MKTKWFLGLTLLALVWAIFGCPTVVPNPAMPTATDTSVFEVSVGNQLGPAAPIAIGESSDIVFQPAPETNLWINPQAQDAAGNNIPVTISAVRLSYIMMSPDESGGWQKYQQYWAPAPKPDWESLGAVLVSLVTLVPAVHPVAYWPCIPPWLYPYPYGHYDGRLVWLGNNHCNWDWNSWGKSAGEADISTAPKDLTVSTGQWVEITPADNQFWVDYQVEYSFQNQGQTWSKSLFGRIWLDNDGDGFTNWEEFPCGAENDSNTSCDNQGNDTVPDLTGLTEPQARTEIGRTCLVVGTVERVVSLNIPVGFVVSWSPHGMVPCGTEIDIVISSGPGNVNVPDLTGLNSAQATVVLGQVGLTVGNITTATSNTVQSNIIISWNPRGSVAVGTAINLVISLGPGTVNVPNVVGMAEQNARDTLTNVGLLIGGTTRQNSDSVASGRVISSAPIAGTSVFVGSSVNLVISSGPVIIPPPNMSVRITTPASGSVFTRTNGSVAVVVKVLSDGDPANGPYKLIVRDSQLDTLTYNNVPLGVESSFNFTITVPGTGFFTAFLADKNGNSLEAHDPYTVQ